MESRGWNPRPDKAGHQPEASLAWSEGDLGCDTQRVVELPATQLAQELGNPLTASLVMLGAFAGLTGLVGLDALVAGMRDSVPAYRSQHLEANEQALRAGFGRVELEVPAWEERAA